MFASGIALAWSFAVAIAMFFGVNNFINCYFDKLIAREKEAAAVKCEAPREKDIVYKSNFRYSWSAPGGSGWDRKLLCTSARITSWDGKRGKAFAEYIYLNESKSRKHREVYQFRVYWAIRYKDGEYIYDELSHKATKLSETLT